VTGVSETAAGMAGSCATGPDVVLDDLEREGLQLGDEGVEFAGVVEPCLVVVELGACQHLGDGLAGRFASPHVVGAVQLRRVGVAATARFAAAGAADLDRPGQRETDL